MQTPLVSIIIPTFNRAHLIGETLDSVLAQTYTNWECIVVDDGSTDNTRDVLTNYCKKDTRFQYHHRPKNRPKGANACRNYGFELCKGEFVNWFDSDDLMLPEFLEKKYKVIVNNELDFVFSHSENIDKYGNQSLIYKESNVGKEINAFSYIKQYIGWITIDFMVKKDSVIISFNEQLKSGQEYNFISRYLFYSTKGCFINELLAFRRVHSVSIQSTVTNLQKDNQQKYIKRTIENKYILLQDIMVIGDIESKLYLINTLVWHTYRLSEQKIQTPYFLKTLRMLYKVKGLKSSFFYLLAIFSGLTLGKGYNLMKQASNYNLK